MAASSHESLELLDGAEVVFARLPRDGVRFGLAPTELAPIQSVLDLLGLRKLRFEGAVVPLGAQDWQLVGRLGATVVQPCTVTLAPVSTRIECAVERRYVAGWEEPETGSETEMPEDDTVEALPRTLDLEAVMIEALSLALPEYPRAEGVDFAGAGVTEPGKAVMRDEDAKPFAGLAAFKARLEGDE